MENSIKFLNWISEKTELNLIIKGYFVGSCNLLNDGNYIEIKIDLNFKIIEL